MYTVFRVNFFFTAHFPFARSKICTSTETFERDVLHLYTSQSPGYCLFVYNTRNTFWTINAVWKSTTVYLGPFFVLPSRREPLQTAFGLYDIFVFDINTRHVLALKFVPEAESRWKNWVLFCWFGLGSWTLISRVNFHYERCSSFYKNQNHGRRNTTNLL